MARNGARSYGGLLTAERRFHKRKLEGGLSHVVLGFSLLIEDVNVEALLDPLVEYVWPY